MEFPWERLNRGKGKRWWEEEFEEIGDKIYFKTVETTHDIGFRTQYCGLKHELKAWEESRNNPNSSQRGSSALACRHRAHQSASEQASLV